LRYPNIQIHVKIAYTLQSSLSQKIDLVVVKLTVAIAFNQYVNSICWIDNTPDLGIYPCITACTA